jgi:hypothetical protein
MEKDPLLIDFLSKVTNHSDVAYQNTNGQKVQFVGMYHDAIQSFHSEIVLFDPTGKRPVRTLLDNDLPTSQVLCEGLATWLPFEVRVWVPPSESDKEGPEAEEQPEARLRYNLVVTCFGEPFVVTTGKSDVKTSCLRSNPDTIVAQILKRKYRDTEGLWLGDKWLARKGKTPEEVLTKAWQDITANQKYFQCQQEEMFAVSSVEFRVLKYGGSPIVDALYDFFLRDSNFNWLAFFSLQKWDKYFRGGPAGDAALKRCDVYKRVSMFVKRNLSRDKDGKRALTSKWVRDQLGRTLFNFTRAEFRAWKPERKATQRVENLEDAISKEVCAIFEYYHREFDVPIGADVEKTEARRYVHENVGFMNEGERVSSENGIKPRSLEYPKKRHNIQMCKD